mgnify:CR=1 FL=1
MKKLFFLTLACGGAMLLNGAELKLHTPEIKGCGGAVTDHLDIENRC